jgi:hypothetical protein
VAVRESDKSAEKGQLVEFLNSKPGCEFRRRWVRLGFETAAPARSNSENGKETPLVPSADQKHLELGRLNGADSAFKRHANQSAD